MKELLLALMILLPFCVAGQQKSKPVRHAAARKHNMGAVVAAPEVFMTVEQRPEFVGGQAALDKYLDQALNYPEAAKEAYVQGRVMVRFMVMEDGSVMNVKVVRGIGAGCDEEAARVVKAMPRWQPGKMNGHPVRAVYVLPIAFDID